MDDKLSARAKSLYELNNNSPLFLRTAEFYLKNNQAQDSLQILEKGSRIFPDHPLLFILLGKAHFKLGNIELADSYIKKASKLLNSSGTYAYYKKELELPDKAESPFDSSRGNIFINAPIDVDDNSKLSSNKLKESISVDDKLDQLARRMMNARIGRQDNVILPEIDQSQYAHDTSKLASETLANIYLSQGEKNEAIKVYELLIHRNPGKKEHYFKKINEIRSRN